MNQDPDAGSPHGQRPSGGGSENADSQGAGSGRQDAPGEDTAELLEGWVTDAHQAETPESRAAEEAKLNAEKQKRLVRYRPRTAKKIAAWISAGLGLLMILPLVTGETQIATSHAEYLVWRIILGGVCYALMFWLPAFYWLIVNRRDSKRLQEWADTQADYRDAWESLDPMMKEIFAQPEKLPLLRKRAWPLIWVVMFVASTCGGMLLPSAA